MRRGREPQPGPGRSDRGRRARKDPPSRSDRCPYACLWKCSRAGSSVRRHDRARDVHGSPIPTIDRETMRAVIAAAKKRGKLAVVHIGSYSGAVDAIEAGADALVHLFADRAPEIRSSVISRRHRVFIVPTMTVPESVGGNAGGAALVESGSMAPWLDETSLRRRSGSGRLFLSYRRRSVQIESLNVFFFRTYLHEWLFSRTSRR